MKAAILCNGMNWTITKKTLYIYIHTYIYIYTYIVKATLTSARCETVLHIRR